MAPRTRRSKTIVIPDIPDNSRLTVTDNQAQSDTHTQGDASNVQRQRRATSVRTTATNANLKGKNRTIAPSTPTRSAAQAGLEIPPAKRARNMGRPRGRPMPLELVNGGEILMAGGGGRPVIVNRNRRRVQRSATPLDPRPRRRERDDPIVADSEDEHISNADSYVETDIDSTHSSLEQDASELAQSQPSRLHQAVRIERPLWEEPARTSDTSTGIARTTSAFLGPAGTSGPAGSVGAEGTSGSSGSIGASGTSNSSGSSDPSGSSHASGTSDSSNTSNPSGSIGASSSSGPSVSSTPVNAGAGNVSNPTTPANDTDLYLIPGNNRLTLSAQKPLIRVIIQDAIEDLRASVLFDHAFPTGFDVLSLSRAALLAAAEKYKPGATAIYERLNTDEDYMARMVRLPRARVPLFRSEVKERCNILVLATLLPFRKPTDVVTVVQKQLMNYNYTFPKAPNASGLVLRARPYRNERIITVIRDLYFGEGTTSFAARFGHRFPAHPGHDGILHKEVPVTMVALVATALYASLYEWRSGEHQPAEFSTSSYQDVYDGHVNTFNYVLERRPCAFHSMMTDLYDQASVTPTRNIAVPVAELNVEELEV